GRQVDAVAKPLESALREIEAPLDEQIERVNAERAEIKAAEEAAVRKALAERAATLAGYGVTVDVEVLSAWSAEEFDAAVAEARAAHEAKEAARKAEQAEREAEAKAALEAAENAQAEAEAERQKAKAAKAELERERQAFEDEKRKADDAKATARRAELAAIHSGSAIVPRDALLDDIVFEQARDHWRRKAEEDAERRERLRPDIEKIRTLSGVIRNAIADAAKGLTDPLVLTDLEGWAAAALANLDRIADTIDGGPNQGGDGKKGEAA
ncbi:MAG: hypothetical protein AAFP86_21240, partial [Planctomycetota bacterium]